MRAIFRWSGPALVCAGTLMLLLAVNFSSPAQPARLAVERVIALPQPLLTPTAAVNAACLRSWATAALGEGASGKPTPSVLALPGCALTALAEEAALRARGSSGGSRRPDMEPLPPSVPAVCRPVSMTFLPHIAHSLRWWPRGSISRANLLERADKYPPTDSHVALHDGRMFYKRVTMGYKERPGSMLKVLARAVDGVHFDDDASLAPPPDLELLLAGMDAVPNGGGAVPVLNTCEHETINEGVAVPDMAFSQWQEAGVFGEGQEDWAVVSAGITAEAAATPYATRVRRVLFRGGLLDEDRAKAMPVIIAHPQLFDAGLRAAPPPRDEPMQIASERRMSLANFSHYAANLYMSGNGYSARLKYLLLTGSPVIFLGGTFRGEIREFYTAALEPFRHYVPATQATLATVAAWVLENPVLAEAIGAAGAAFARKFLSPRAVSCWWRVFLAEYAAHIMQEGEPPGPAFLPMNSSSDVFLLVERYQEFKPQ